MRELTKWPRLLVAGVPVTEEQANEILIRTMPFSLFTNDKDWEQQVCDTLGVAREPKYGMPSFESLGTVRESLRCLDLHYLENWQIASAWLGGPHGWCDWNGTIGCADFNIGKWPSVEEVTEDWTAIAEAWPFLDLRAQLVPNEGEPEGDEQLVRPAVEWIVRDGSVTTIDEPGELLRQPKDPFFLASLLRGGERGVSIDRLRAAVEQVRNEPERTA